MVHKLITALWYHEQHLHVAEIPNNLQKTSHISIIIFPLNPSICERRCVWDIRYFQYVLGL